jgi:hypothetical protein
LPEGGKGCASAEPGRNGLKRLPDLQGTADLHIYRALLIAQFLGLSAGFGQHAGLPPVTDFAGNPKAAPRADVRGRRETLLTTFAPRPNSATRLAKDARARWIAKLLENPGHRLHARADRLESRDDRAQD